MVSSSKRARIWRYGIGEDVVIFVICSAYLLYRQVITRSVAECDRDWKIALLFIKGKYGVVL